MDLDKMYLTRLEHDIFCFGEGNNNQENVENRETSRNFKY